MKTRLDTAARPLQLCLPFEETAPSGLSEAELSGIYSELLGKIYQDGRPPHIEVRYYPYAGINSTIRSRQKKFLVRVSDVLRHAPGEIHRALATILLNKILRRRVPKRANDLFGEYCRRPAVAEAHDNSRRVRGRKLLSDAAGSTYDLNEHFHLVNSRYFGGALRPPKLSWSRTKTRRIFGHHDPVHNAIVVSKSLDDPKVPVFVVQYILYHEMLHLKNGSTRRHGKVIHHNAEFRREERRFAHYKEASDWLNAFVAATRRRRRRRS